MDKLNILLLADHNNPTHAGTIQDHIEALLHLSDHDVRIINPRFGERLPFIDLNHFDVILIHYSLWIIWESYLSSVLVEKIRKSRALKALFIQDEYRYVNMTIDKMVELGIDVLFSCIPEKALMKVYGDQRLKGVRKESVLTGYVPDYFLKGVEIPSISKRTIDIGYRSRSNPYWLGKLSHEKILISEGVLKQAQSLELNCDISVREEDRIYGREWRDFLSNCRAVLGTGSGASIVDFDGVVEAKVNEYLMNNASASFDEVFGVVLAPYDNNVVIDTISPRVFEAAITRTAQIMFESPYEGIIQPSIHYIPLKRDFSNLAEISQLIRDDDYLEELTERTYFDLIASGKYNYSKFSQFVNQVLEEEGRAPEREEKRAQFYARGKTDVLGQVALSLSSVISSNFLIRGYGGAIRHGKALLTCLMSPLIMAFLIALIVKDKGQTQRLYGIIRELTRIAILRKKKLKGINGTRLTLKTYLEEETLYFEGMVYDGAKKNRDVNLVENHDAIVEGLRDGSVRNIIWRTRLSQMDRPEFFEGESPIFSIFSFHSLARIGKEFPLLIGRILSIGPIEQGATRKQFSMK